MRRINLDIMLGILIGIAASLLFASPWHWEHGLLDKEFVVGVLSLAGAAGAIFVVIRQIDHAQAMEDERRWRQSYAARAMVPHALASLCDYAERCCSDLRGIVGDENLLPTNSDGIVIPETFQLTELPSTSMEPLQKLLQFGDREIQNAIAVIMQLLQVQQSSVRIRHMGTNQTFGYQYYARITEAVEIYARAALLFKYARKVPEKASDELTAEEMKSAATHCGFWHPKWDRLKDFIETNWQPYKPK
jgi:hypothetical protein